MAADPESVAEAFRRLAEDFENGGSPLYARLARGHADDPLVADLCRVERPRWQLPLLLFGGVHYLVLSGRAPSAWTDLPGALATHAVWLRRFIAEQPIQTNEVQRSWGLLPAFLTVEDGRPLDLVELGSSAGLNLVWDRYHYQYGDARWGEASSPLELTGQADGGPPVELFDRKPSVRARLGIDRAPVDVTSEEDALLLASFVWADQTARLARLRAALDVVRDDPPTVVAGDYVSLLPDVLARRDLSVLTVVYHSVTIRYVPPEDRETVRETIELEGERGALAHVSFEFEEEQLEAYDSFVLDVTSYPSGETRRLARLDAHGNRLQWLG